MNWSKGLEIVINSIPNKTNVHFRKLVNNYTFDNIFYKYFSLSMILDLH